ncbi:hypothetical protein ACFUP3_20875 [Bacillus paralicheniformis]|uniref:hypothetical protein n=1 Tax=Bacillus paralicheniformis TaxID=1648923 RepID=UPI0036309773
MIKTWNELSDTAKTILERVDVNRRDLLLIKGEQLKIKFAEGVIDQNIIDEIEAFERSEDNEGYFETEQNAESLLIKFLKPAL